MDIRKTARLILLNQQDEILLMNIKSHASDPKASIEKPFWVTIGGEIETGETLQEAAFREGLEETGHSNIKIGPAVWYGTVVLNWKGVPTELQETFVIAKTDEVSISRTGLSEEEQEVVQKYQWWSVDDLLETDDIVIPRDLAYLLSDIISGNYPKNVIDIDLSTPDENKKKLEQKGQEPKPNIL